MLRKQKKFAVFTQNQCLAFLGSKFQPVLGLSDILSDIEVGRELLRKVLFVHLTKDSDKFELLVYGFLSTTLPSHFPSLARSLIVSFLLQVHDSETPGSGCR